MRKQLGLAAFFFFCVCVFIVVNVPVTQVVSRIELPRNFNLSGLSGTLLDGSVENLEVNQIQFSGLNYQMQLGCLLVLDICYQVDADQGHAQIAVGLVDQAISLSDVDINYALEDLAALSNKLLVQPAGNLQIKLSRLNLREQQVGDIEGSILWQQAGLVGESIALGDYELLITPEDGAYRFKLNDHEALLNVDGNGQLKSNGQYSLNIKIQSKPGLKQSIKTALEFVARKQGLNNYDVRRTGKLPNRMLAQLFFNES